MLMKIGIMEMIMKKKRIMIKAMLKMYVAAALWKEPFLQELAGKSRKKGSKKVVEEGEELNKTEKQLHVEWQSRSRCLFWCALTPCPSTLSVTKSANIKLARAPTTP